MYTLRDKYHSTLDCPVRKLPYCLQTYVLFVNYLVSRFEVVFFNDMHETTMRYNVDMIYKLRKLLLEYFIVCIR